MHGVGDAVDVVEVLDDMDRVVDQGNGYVLVEKIVAVDEVVAADPRSRSA